MVLSLKFAALVTFEFYGIGAITDHIYAVCSFHTVEPCGLTSAGIIKVKAPSQNNSNPRNPSAMSNRLSRAAKTEIVFLLHTFEIHRVSREFHYLARLLDEGIDVYSISDEAYETCTTSPTMDAFMERLFADGQPLELCIVRRRTGVLPSIVEVCSICPVFLEGKG